MTSTKNDNIHFYMYEEEDTDKNVDLSFLLNEFEQLNNESDTNKGYIKSSETFYTSGCEDDLIISEINNYEINFTNKQLILILEYYGLSKGIRTMKKQDLISSIMMFEKDTTNMEITRKRKLLWHYMDELKKDKVLKRFILSSI